MAFTGGRKVMSGSDDPFALERTAVYTVRGLDQVFFSLLSCSHRAF